MKRIGIEELLRWAYRDELPKDGAVQRLRDRPVAHGRGWGGVERFGELLEVIDAPVNDWGVVPDFGALSEPDPAAVLIGDHVAALDAFALNLPDGWNPLAEMGDLGALGAVAVTDGLDRATVVDAAGERRLRRPLSELVRVSAVMGPSDAWEADRPVVAVETAHGKPLWFRRAVVTDIGGVGREVEVDGYNVRAQRPYPGAYRRHRLEPCPVDAVVGRIEFAAWHAALGLLAGDLGAALAGRFAVAPTERPAQPWLTAEAAPRRVREDASAPLQAWPLTLWGGAGLAQLREYRAGAA